jgi:hypothetical protein
LFDVQWGPQRRAAEAFALAALVGPGAALIERAYLAGLADGGPMAPEVPLAAALSLVLLPLGILVARPDRGLAAMLRSEGVGSTAWRRPRPIRPLGYADDVEFCRMLPEQVGVAAIPPSSFYERPANGRHLVRWAFCKTDDVLDSSRPAVTWQPR